MSLIRRTIPGSLKALRHGIRITIVSEQQIKWRCCRYQVNGRHAMSDILLVEFLSHWVLINVCQPTYFSLFLEGELWKHDSEIQSRILSKAKLESKFKILTITICEQFKYNINSSRASIILIVYMCMSV